MKIVRPYGQSFTDLSSQKRKLRKRQAPTKAEASAEFRSFLNDDPDAIIAAFISVIDKIYGKPRMGRAPRALYDAREALGQACWPLVLERITSGLARASKTADMADYEPKWQWKLHPYLEVKRGREGSTDPADLDFDDRKKLENFQGRWRHVFYLTDAPSDDELRQVAEKIDRHLFVRARRIHGDDEDSRSNDDQRGLIAYRAEAVEKSLPLNKLDLIPETWGDAEQSTYLERYDPAREIYGLAVKAESDERPRRLRPKDVGQVFTDSYCKVFREPFDDPPEKKTLAENGDRLFALHEDMRLFYKRLVRSSRRGLKTVSTKKSAKSGAGNDSQALSSILPEDGEALCALLRKRRKNKNVNRLIRHGRLLHYAGVADGDPASDPDRMAYYRTADGQAEIKRTEAFVRVWRTSIGQGARTLRALAYPDDKGPAGGERSREDNQDILSDANIRALPEHFDAGHSAAKLKLLFGDAASRFPDPVQDPDGLLALVQITLNRFRNLRNSAFHFRNRQQFVQTIADSLDKGLAAIATADISLPICTELLAGDHARRQENLRKNLEAIRLCDFVEQRQVDAIWHELTQGEGGDLPLPKFHKLLGHLQNVGGSKLFDGAQLPVKPNAEALKDPATLCQYSTLKYLYEGPFRAFCSEVEPERVERYTADVIERGKERAQKANRLSGHHDFVESKAAKLPRPGQDGLWAYFHALDGEMATEMRVQKGYEPDPEQSREKAAFITGFQCELVASLFLGYLFKNGFAQSLLRIRPGDTGTQAACLPQAEANVPTGDQAYQEWEAKLYFLLHVIPIDDLSMLLHQFRKFEAVTRKAAGNGAVAASDGSASAITDEDRLRRIVVLCVEMHADKFDGTGSNIGLDQARRLFENDAAFDRLFNVDDQGVALQSTRRGLREMLRFGHLGVFAQAFGGGQITGEEIAKVQNFEQPEGDGLSKIAKLQRERIRLHDKAVKKTRSFTLEDLDRYRDLVLGIADHRMLAARVRLTDFIRLHNIALRVLGRLIDYANTWERDRYFVFLALLDRKGVALEELLDIPGLQHRYETIKQQNLQDGSQGRANSDLRAAREAVESIRAGNVGYRALSDAHRSLLDELDTYVPFLKQEIRDIRNDLAHFNVLDRAGRIDLTEQINRVRTLMAYDRKLKNAVSKSIKELLAREGFAVTWSMSAAHRLERVRVATVELTHLTRKTSAGSFSEPTGEIIRWKDRQSGEQRSRAEKVGDVLKKMPVKERKVTKQLEVAMARLLGSDRQAQKSDK